MKTWPTLLAAVLLAAATPAAAELPPYAHRHLQLLASLTPERLEALRTLADSGQAEAMMLLGEAYGLGFGDLPIDDARAAEWLRRAAAAGQPGAAREAAFFEFRLREAGTLASGAAALERAERALAGDADPDGDVPADRPDPALVRLAERGVEEAQMALASMRASGRGLTRDPAEARRWYEKAASLGNVEAHHALGRMHRRGEGGPIDWAAAAAHLRDAAARGHAPSQVALAALLTDPECPAPAPEEAMKWLIAAASLGDAEAGARMRDVSSQLTTEQALAAAEQARLWAAHQRPSTPSPPPRRP